MNYEVGKYYRTRDGSKAKCIHRLITGNLVFVIDTQDMGWNVYATKPDGRARRDDHGDDIISPWIDRPVVDWSKMPACAMFCALESNNKWVWFADPPDRRENSWCPTATGVCGFLYPEHCPSWTGDWRDSLVERPKV